MIISFVLHFLSNFGFGKIPNKGQRRHLSKIAVGVDINELKVNSFNMTWQ